MKQNHKTSCKDHKTYQVNAENAVILPSHFSQFSPTSSTAKPTLFHLTSIHLSKISTKNGFHKVSLCSFKPPEAE